LFHNEFNKYDGTLSGASFVQWQISKW
jgi:hypothetical protein